MRLQREDPHIHTRGGKMAAEPFYAEQYELRFKEQNKRSNQAYIIAVLLAHGNRMIWK